MEFELTSTLSLDPRCTRTGPALLLALGLVVIGTPATAQTAPNTAGIYTCTDEQGRRLTADRPIAQCNTKEQRVLNSDGSLRAIHPPTLTAEERAEKEARDRRAGEVRAAAAARYPTEESHQRAREAALDSVRMAAKGSEIRLRELTAERKPLLDDAEFYKGRALPGKLKAQLDANEAATEAQRSSALNQEAELARINKLYDAELERLRRLWVGAPAGSLGPLPGSGSAAKSAPQPKTALQR
jgi:hypothetical protein